LANDSNREEIQYWANEIQDFKIGYILTNDRIKQALSLPTGRQEIYVFVFNHIKNNKIYFYSASNIELEDNTELKKIFLGYGSRKASWRVFKLQLTNLSLEDAYRPLSISNAINESVKRQNQKPSPRLMSKLKHLKHIAVLTNITDDIGTDHYQKYKIPKGQLSKLATFAHPRNRPPAPVSVYRFKYINQRRETRFMLRTSVKIKIDDIVLDGHTEDISTKGLKVELQKILAPAQATRVELSFPQLQSVTSKYNLVDLPYVVRETSKDGYVLHLQNFVTEEHNTARRFFEALIKANRSKLKSYRDEEEVPGIGEALRNIYSKNIVNIGFFLRKHGANFVPDALATRTKSNRLANLLQFQADKDEGNLYPIFKNGKTQHDFVSGSLTNLKPSSKPISKELYIAFDPSHTNIEKAVISQFVTQFSQDEKRREFISSALNNGQFIAIKIFLARTGRPDFDIIQSELNYVSIYALHKAKLLEERLWSVIAMGDMVDVTDEVLRRFKFEPSVVEKNHIMPKTHKIKKVGIEQILKT
jgi:hypothetical protein